MLLLITHESLFDNCRPERDEEELAIFRQTYTDKVYKYWEYDCILNGRCYHLDKDPKI
jgi:hypothetical protein